MLLCSTDECGDPAEDEVETDEALQFREAVAKKYARYFRATMHHNNGYFMQASVITYNNMCRVNKTESPSMTCSEINWAKL